MRTEVFRPGTFVVVREKNCIREELSICTRSHLGVSGFRNVGEVRRCTAETAFVTFRMFSARTNDGSVHWLHAKPTNVPGTAEDDQHRHDKTDWIGSGEGMPETTFEVGLTFALSCLMTLREFVFGRMIYSLREPFLSANYAKSLSMSAKVVAAEPSPAAEFSDASCNSDWQFNDELAAQIALINKTVHAEVLAETHALRSLCFLADGNVAQAIEEGNCAIAQCPNSSIGYVRCAAAFNIAKKFDVSKEILEAAITRCGAEFLSACDDGFKDAWMNLEVLQRFDAHLRRNHVEQWGVEVSYDPRVREIDLIALCPFSVGETIFREKAVAIVANANSTHPLCEYCGRLLCDKAEVLRTVASTVPQVLSHLRSSFLGVTPVACHGECGAVYCSDVCRELAFKEYHRVSCPTSGILKIFFRNISELVHDLSCLEWCTAELTSKILAHVLSHYEQNTVDNTGAGGVTTENATHLLHASLDAIAGKFALPLPSEQCVMRHEWKDIRKSLPDGDVWAPVPDFMYSHFRRVVSYCSSRSVQMAKCPLNVGTANCVPEYLEVQWESLRSEYVARFLALYPVLGTAHQSRRGRQLRSNSALSLDSDDDLGAEISGENSIIVASISQDGSEAVLQCTHPIAVHEPVIARCACEWLCPLYEI